MFRLYISPGPIWVVFFLVETLSIIVQKFLRVLKLEKTVYEREICAFHAHHG